jgi:hypothetical protein
MGCGRGSSIKSTAFSQETLWDDTSSLVRSTHPLSYFSTSYFFPLLGSVALVMILIVATLRQFVAELDGDEQFDEGFLTSLWWSIIAV